MDVIFSVLLVGFFVAAWGLSVLCERLAGTEGAE